MPKCCVDYLNPINPPTMHHEIVNPADFGRVHLGQLAPAPPPKKKRKERRRGERVHTLQTAFASFLLIAPPIFIASFSNVSLTTRYGFGWTCSTLQSSISSRVRRCRSGAPSVSRFQGITPVRGWGVNFVLGGWFCCVCCWVCWGWG